MDLNGSGSISKDELDHAFEVPELAAVLAHMGMDDHGARRLFELIDMDESGQVNLKEFVVGFLQSRGQAKSLDIQILLKETDKLRENQKAMKTMMDSLLDGQGSIRNLVQDEPAGSAENNDSRHEVDEVDEVDHEDSGTFAAGARRRCSKVAELYKGMSVEEIEEVSDVIYGTLAGKQRSIEDPSQRAMLLTELQQIHALIRSLCNDEAWTDLMTGKALTPSKVNLYNFDYFVISPRTVPDGVVVCGLTHQQYKKNQVLQQFNGDGKLIAEGRLLEDVEGENLHVRVAKGRFVSRNAHGELEAIIDGKPCGIPDHIDLHDSLSYKELISSEPTEPTWFCCHWWGEPIHDFVACCKQHARFRGQSGREASYWVCAYANRQHDLGADISDDPQQSSFRRAMKVAQGLLLVLDPNATPFVRIWCDFEIFNTVCGDTTSLDIITMSGKPRLLTTDLLPNEEPHDKFQRERDFPVQILGRGLQVKLETGQASVEKDRVSILKSIGTDKDGTFNEELQKDNCAKANMKLRAQFAMVAWPQALENHVVHKFPVYMPDGTQQTVSLPDILSSDIDRKSVDMTFGGLKINDSDIGLISRGLPPCLESLKLNFESCHGISDRGVALLAQALHGPLKSSLRRLDLDFIGCKALTDAGVDFLAKNMPPNLEALSLNFALNPCISISAVQSLAACIPRSVHELNANFEGTAVSKQFKSARELQKAAKQSGMFSSPSLKQINTSVSNALLSSPR